MNDYKRTVLIVDDNEFNRDFLTELLSDEYFVLKAENGQVAFDLLKSDDGMISAVLLDMHMPVMDGATFLDAAGKDAKISKIPVIIMTTSDDIKTEVSWLNKGAVDFIPKPFHPDAVKARLKNAINLRESVAMLSATEFDELTGFYTRGAFLKHAEILLQKRPDVRFDLVTATIFDFDQISYKYGSDMATEVVRCIGQNVLEGDTEYCITGRFDNEQFAALIQVDADGADGMEQIKKTQIAIETNSPVKDVKLKYAIYENVEHNIPVYVLCSRAFNALQQIRHSYGVTCAKYSPEVQKEIDILNELEDGMVKALEEKQFEVYYQPKFYVADGKDRIAGAEALVRWVHPDKGFIKPDVFIGMFEKNGFISKLDRYMLENVCRDIKEWREQGIPVFPVSVNLSRVDFSIADLAQRAEEIVDSYGIPHELIHFEVTESAFTKHDGLLKTIIHQLHSAGFSIELDDFGTGYSSLSSLQSLDLDMVKLDMSLIREDDPNSGKSVLELAHNIVNMMKMKTVQEGVETQSELERVRDLGCAFVQGFYFSKPLCKKDFVTFIKNMKV